MSCISIQYKHYFSVFKKAFSNIENLADRKNKHNFVKTIIKPTNKKPIIMFNYFKTNKRLKLLGKNKFLIHNGI